MPPYQSYLNQQLQNNQDFIQKQINYLQSLQQQAQALQTPQVQQPQTQVQQPVQQTVQQQQTGISMQIVDNFESISANDVPMDNRGAFFVKSDGTEVQYRKWNANGAIDKTSYFPHIDKKEDKADDSSNETEKAKIDLSDELTGVFMKRFDELLDRIGGLEEFLKKPTPKTRTKKENEDAK